MNRLPPPSLVVLLAAIGSATACGAGGSLSSGEREIPSGEQTASAAAEASKSGDDIVLYASSSPDSPDTGSDGNDAGARGDSNPSPEPNTDGTTNPGTTALYRVEYGEGRLRITGDGLKGTPAYTTFERILQTLRTPSSEPEPGADAGSTAARAPDATSASDFPSSWRSDWNPETIRIDAIRVRDDGSFVVAGTAKSDEDLREFRKRVGSVTSSSPPSVDSTETRDDGSVDFQLRGSTER